MSDSIRPTHPLHGYHRRRPNRAGRSDAELRRQWGAAEIVAGIPAGGVQAGSYQSITIRFTVGSMGLDEDGGLKFSFRFVSDMGRLQTTEPTHENYVSVATTGAAAVEVQVEPKGTRRPFQRTLLLHCRRATLHEGDTIDVVLGDTSFGSPGWRQQTYVETPFPVRVAVDPLGAHDYQELPRDLGWNIVPGAAVRHVVHAPSFAACGEPFAVRVKSEDAWGNPLRDSSATPPRLVLIGPAGERQIDVDGVHSEGVWTHTLSVPDEGSYRFRSEGQLASLSNGLTVRDPDRLPRHRYAWCDLHGQTGETVGAGTIEDYFHFGRHFAFLDASAHQGNDFQIGLDLWEHIKEVSNDVYEPGRFVTFQGYEWSGTEAMGGDHNVLFHEDDPPIYRSTGWLDGNPFEEYAPLPALYEALRPHVALTIAHVGGRPSALTVSDPDLERLMEVHSAWGTFEWVYREAFARGFKIGFVCNSDGHKARPGASYPGAGIFGTLGGLTCALADRLDRDAVWEALRSRRCYGTTGQRIVVESDMNGLPIGSDVQADHATIHARVLGTSPIVRLDLLRGTEVVQSHVPAYDAPADTLVVRFGGARVKGRARMVRWNGTVTVEGNRFTDATIHGLYSPAYGIDENSEERVTFHCATTGNLVNLQQRFAEGLRGIVRFDTNRASAAIDLVDLGREPRVLFEAPLDQRVEAFTCCPDRLPLELEATFDIDVDHDDEVPYFLRVLQLDEGKAWTSPFYVRPGSAD